MMDQKQEIIIKELKVGKSIKEAAKTAGTLEIIVNRWIRLGKEGDDRYTQFCNEYEKIMGVTEDDTKHENEKEEELSEKKSITAENRELVKKAIELLKDNKNLDDINQILDIPEYKTKNWYTQGKLGIKPFDEFYTLLGEVEANELEKNEFNKEGDILKDLNLKELDFILEDNKQYEMVPNKDVKIKTILENIDSDNIKKSVEKLNELKSKQSEISLYLEQFNNELLLSFLNKYDSVLYKNKSRDQIIDRIIKELKFTDTEDFYNEMYKLPKEEKINIGEIKKTGRIKEAIIEEKDVKNCIVCGKELKKYTTRDKCKTCSRSIHAANILNGLLNKIGPEVPFFKEDLEKLGYSTIKIQDIIWTLQENDLINKESSKKYSLKNKNVLNKFLDEWKDYVEEVDEEEGIRLSKKCIICNKELPITKFNQSNLYEDGFEEYCKDCARPIQTAIGLKNLLKYTNPEVEFLKEDFYEHYQAPFLLDAEIFSLQEYDLIEYNSENNIYSLKNKEKLDKFLDKYLIDDEDDTSNIEINTPEDENGNEESETGENNEPTHIEEEEPEEAKDTEIAFVNYAENDLINKIMNIFINELKISKNIEKAYIKANLTKPLLNTWLRFGKQGLKDFEKFYEDYNNIINTINENSEPVQRDTRNETSETETNDNEENDEYAKDDKEYEFGYSIQNHTRFIEEIRNGKTDHESLKIIGLSRYQIDKWHDKGLNGEEPYAKFQKDYLNAKIYAKNNNEFFKKENEVRRKIFIDHIKKGKTLRAACDFSGLKFENVKRWINLGNKGEDPYKEFYQEYISAKKEYENQEIIITDDESKSPIKILISEKIGDQSELIIKGKVENDNLIRSVYKLCNYQNDIQKIISNRINEKESEILIILKTQSKNIESIKKMFL